MTIKNIKQIALELGVDVDYLKGLRCNKEDLIKRICGFWEITISYLVISGLHPEKLPELREKVKQFKNKIYEKKDI